MTSGAWLTLSSIKVRKEFWTFRSSYFTLFLIVSCNVVNNKICSFWIGFSSFRFFTEISSLVEKTFPWTRNTCQWRNVEQIPFRWTLNTPSFRWIIIWGIDGTLFIRVILYLLRVLIKIISYFFCWSSSEIWCKTVSYIGQFLSSTKI